MIRSTNNFQFHFYFGCFASRNSKGTITFHSFHRWVLGRAVPAIIEQSQLMVVIITVISLYLQFSWSWGFFGLFFPWFSLHFSWGVYFNCSPVVHLRLPSRFVLQRLLQHLEERLELRSSLPDFKGQINSCHWDPLGPWDLEIWHWFVYSIYNYIYIYNIYILIYI